MKVDSRRERAVSPFVRLVVGTLLLASLVACPGNATSLPPDSAGHDGGGADASSRSAFGDDTSASGFHVSISPPAPTVCAGGCVDLVASASGGVAPVLFAWDHGLPETTGPVHVCPAATTTYGLVAQGASAGAGEVPTPTSTGSASVTVTVVSTGSACDGTPAGDGGPSVAPPTSTARELCSQTWAQAPDLQIENALVATADDGGVFIGATYLSNLWGMADAGPSSPLNLGTPSPAYPQGFVVAKLDADCHLAWSREFGTATFDSLVRVAAIASDAASNVTVLGSFEGTADLGAGVTTAPGAAFLLRLDASGKTLWSKTFVSPSRGAEAPSDLAVTPDGVTTIAIDAEADTDFGSGPDGLFANFASKFYLVRFDASGGLVFREAVEDLGGKVTELFHLATNASGRLWAAGNAGELSSVALVALTPAGALDWVQPSPSNLASSMSVAAGASNEAFTAGDVVSTLDGPHATSVSAFATDGTSAWSRTSPPFDVPVNGILSDIVVVDTQGSPVVAYDFDGAATLSTGGSLVSGGGYDVGVRAYDPAGRVTSEGRWGGPDDESLEGVALDPAGNVFLSGVSAPGNPTNTSAETLFVAKLAR